MNGNINNVCLCSETELKELCKKYLEKQIDQTTFRKKTKELKKKYETEGVANYSFAYLLICGYLNLFSEYSPDENSFRIDVENVLSKIENNPYINESWLVTLEKNDNKDIELLRKYWTDSVNKSGKENERLMCETEKILKNKMAFPGSVRDVIYNNIIATMSMHEPFSGNVLANHTVGADNCKNQNTRDKLNYLFDVWFGKEKLFFQFNYVAGNVYIWII